MREAPREVEVQPGATTPGVRDFLGPATLVGFAVAALYWVAETALHAFVFETGDFVTELSADNSNERWMRLFTVALFIVLGAGVQRYLTRVRSYEGRVRILASAVHQAGESVLITDLSGVIEYVNPAFTANTGYQPAEVIGQTPAVLRSGATEPAAYRELWATISDGRVWSGAFTDRRKDGSFFPVAVTIAPVLDERGQIAHYVGIQRDLSDRVELENRLRHAAKLETLGTLVGGLAHDFNNVLATVTLLLQLASRRAGEDAELRQLLGSAGESVDGAAATIRQLLAFARTGAVGDELRPLELRAWLERTWPGLRLAVPASITSRLELPPEGTWVRADAAALQQALTNLVYNARDALEGRPKGTLAVSCGLLPAGEAPPRAYLRVADDGPGVPAELKERIFEPFFTTKGEGRGLGLGLAMVKEAVRRHGGALRVDDRAGGGATFEVLLPVVAPAPGGEAATAERPRGQGELVLLADDHRPFRASARLLLESLGYRVLEAANGQEAVALFKVRADEVKAVLLDVLMPPLNGPEAAAQIRALRAGVPVLFATGFDDGELARQGVLAGSEVLTKPFRPELLAQRLRQALERR